MVIATYAGTGGFIWWIALVIPFIISSSYRMTGVILIVTLTVNYLISEVLIKKTVGRIRPSALLSEDEMKITKPKDYSFPSGHAASSFSVCAVTMFYCPSFIWIPSIIAALLIAFSRLYLRVHYLSDVVVGIDLGLFNGFAVSLLFRCIILPTTLE